MSFSLSLSLFAFPRQIRTYSQHISRIDMSRLQQSWVRMWSTHTNKEWVLTSDHCHEFIRLSVHRFWHSAKGSKQIDSGEHSQAPLKWKQEALFKRCFSTICYDPPSPPQNSETNKRTNSWEWALNYPLPCQNPDPFSIQYPWEVGKDGRRGPFWTQTHGWPIFGSHMLG